jgi:hypothetical protein
MELLIDNVGKQLLRHRLSSGGWTLTADLVASQCR